MTDNKAKKVKKSTSKNTEAAKATKAVKTPKATKSKTKSTKVVQTPVDPVPVEPTQVEPTDPTPVEPTESTESTEPTESTESTESVSNSITITSTPKEILNTLINESKEMVTSTKRMVLLLKNVCKSYDKSLKTLHKTTRKNKKRDVNSKPRLPSGFAKPTQISDTLCDFYGVPHGTLVSRTDITKSITQHIKKKDLQVSDNRRRFIPDNKLETILSPLDTVRKDKKGITDSEKGYTYFNLQRYISDQFIKS